MDGTNRKVLVYTFNGYDQRDGECNHRMVVRIPEGIAPEDFVELLHRIGRKDAHIEQSNEVKPCGGCGEFGGR